MTSSRRDSPLRTLAVVGERNGSSMWRIWQPFAALQRLGYPAVWGWNQDASLYLTAGGADAICLPRMAWTDAQGEAREKWFADMHRANKCVIFEVDDDHFSPWFVKHLTISEWKTQAEAEVAARVVAQALKLCDGVTVSVPRLATLVRTLTDKPVVVVPNAIDLRWFDAVLARALRAPAARGHLTIGWSGARRPERDFDVMLGAWQAIHQKHPDVRFVISGYTPKAILDYLPESKLIKLPWLALEEYPLGLRSIDIGCCALADDPFNRCKSDIKAQEYGAAKIAVVYSPTVYGRVLRDGKDGLQASTTEEWTRALDRLVEDQRLRRRLAQNLHKRVVKEMCLDVNLWRWPVAWEAIYDDYTLSKARASLVVARR